MGAQFAGGNVPAPQQGMGMRPTAMPPQGMQMPPQGMQMGARPTGPMMPQQVGAPGFSGLAPYLRQGQPRQFNLPQPAQLGQDRAAYQQRLAERLRNQQAGVDAYKTQQAEKAAAAQSLYDQAVQFSATTGGIPQNVYGQLTPAQQQQLSQDPAARYSGYDPGFGGGY